MASEMIPSDNYSNIEKVIIGGDLGKLSPQERTNYYMTVCNSLGLNPLTKPFEYIQLNGKLTLYATRNCAEQLRRIYGVSVTDMEQQVNGDILVVKVSGRDREGRMDVASGAICLGNLKGEALANAYLKCETKAKRRLTLSICGLGMLDETEVDSIPNAVKGEPAQAAPLQAPAPKPKFGLVVKRAAERFPEPISDITECIFEHLTVLYPDEISVDASTDWKTKGEIMGRLYEISSAEQRDHINQVVFQVAKALHEQREQPVG